MNSYGKIRMVRAKILVKKPILDQKGVFFEQIVKETFTLTVHWF